MSHPGSRREPSMLEAWIIVQYNDTKDSYTTASEGQIFLNYAAAAKAYAKAMQEGTDGNWFTIQQIEIQEWF